MRTRSRALILVFLLALVTASTLGYLFGRKPVAPGAEGEPVITDKFPDANEGIKTRPVDLKNEIPPEQSEAVYLALLQGLGHMERYEYAAAAKNFREIRERAPGWIPGSINLAIALLNDVGAQAEAARKSGKGASGDPNYSEPIDLLTEVLERDPNNPYAHYCIGLIIETTPDFARANREFEAVTKIDPKDGHAWLKYGSTLPSAADPERPASPKDAPRRIEIFQKALDCNPYLVTAAYRLSRAYIENGDRKRWDELTKRNEALDPKKSLAGPGDSAEAFYGEAGKYARIISPFPVANRPRTTAPPPKFAVPMAIKVTLPEGTRWAKADDFTGPLAVIGHARARFGATAATFDADSDGRADIFLASAVKGPKGLHDVLLLNKGGGAFEDATAAWGLPDDRASLGASAADFDADKRVDLFLTGGDDNHLLRNVGGKTFEDVTQRAGMAAAKSLGLTARWADLDQDGDLDLYVVNYTDRASAASAFVSDPSTLPKVTNTAYRNDGVPTAGGSVTANWAPLAVTTEKEEEAKASGLTVAFTPWPRAEGLHGPPGHYTAVAAVYLDPDRDLDLVVVDETAPPLAVLNDRLGIFHSLPIQELAGTEPPNGLLVSDFDKDGRADLAILRRGGRVNAWRNLTDESSARDTFVFQPWPIESKAWRTAVATDIDLDTWPDLLGLPDKPALPTLIWADNDGHRFAEAPLPVPPPSEEFPGPIGFAFADLAADALPDLVLLADGQAPTLAVNKGNGLHWVAIELGGRWKVGHDHMRTNSQGLGTRLALEGQGLHVTYDDTSPSAGLGQSVGPFVLGLGESPRAELVRLSWPDGTIQCEMNQGADVTLPITEYNRKTGSCPVLFTWNGERFVCLGDFLGGGGIGYLVAPGVYGQPDPDESVAIAPEELKAEKGVYRLSIAEPMDEVSYLDQLQLVVVDRPPGVSVGLDERFAPEGTRPTGETIAWTAAIRPERATDLGGRDVLRTLSAFDRDTVSEFKLLRNWVGYAEEHGIVLDFGDHLSRFGPKAPLVLALAGWVEYPYSQTNYAAATAGLALKPPVIERQQPDGSWSVIEPHAGYPAGLPRLTTLDLTGKLTGPKCVIRIRTNMELYWDQAFVALRDRSAESSLRQTTLPVARAVLEHRGYFRETSPDGREPLLYDYDHVDPCPLAPMGGELTRLGDVAELLRAVDDRHCVVGPGDEVRAEFDAEGLPDLPKDWTRSYVLKSHGYCKDADPFTAGSDRVEPLPWRGMPEYPFAGKSANASRPADPAYRDYLERFQTRPAGSR